MKKLLFILSLFLLLGCSTNSEPTQQITKPLELNQVNNLIKLKTNDITINTDKEFNVDKYIEKSEGTVVSSVLNKEDKILTITAINGNDKQKLEIPVKLEESYPVKCWFADTPSVISITFLNDKIYKTSIASYEYKVLENGNFYKEIVGPGVLDRILVDDRSYYVPHYDGSRELMVCDKKLPWLD